eukprot:6104719-Alexandrium_andersonii.AAC.1
MPTEGRTRRRQALAQETECDERAVQTVEARKATSWPENHVCARKPRLRRKTTSWSRKPRLGRKTTLLGPP